MKKLTKYFVSGLMFTLPIVVTVLIFSYLYDKLARLLRGPFVAIYNSIHVGEVSLYELLPKHMLAVCAEAMTAVVLFFLLAFVGWVVNRTLRQCKDNAVHRFLEHLPVVRSIFKPVNQAVQSLLGDGMKGRRVVRFPYPAEPYWGVGIVMDEVVCDGVELYVVMMPLTMSAGTGVLLRIPRSCAKIVDVDATTALEHVITCGMIPLSEKSCVANDVVTDVEQFWDCVRKGQREICFRYAQPVENPPAGLPMRRKKEWYCRLMTARREQGGYSFSDWLKVRLYAGWYYRNQMRKYRCQVESEGNVVRFFKGKAGDKV